MIKFTTKKPHIRKLEIAKVVDKIALHKDGTVAEFGLTVSNQMAKTPGRVLQAPAIGYGKRQNQAPRVGSGAWDFNRKVVHTSGKKLEYYAIINFSNANDSAIRNGMEQLARTANTTGVPMAARPAYALVNRPYAQPDSDEIRQCFEKLMKEAEEKRQPLDRVFVILEDANAQFYQAVKYVSDGMYGIPCSCLQKKWFTGKFPIQAMANIALKSNAKAGGVNYTCHSPDAKPGEELLTHNGKRVMVVGGDLTHPPKSDEDMYTLCSLVASMDGISGKYVARVAPNPAKVDIIDNMQGMFSELLDEYALHNNNAAPESIVYYRDGVSEGQFQEVMAVEMAGIVTATLAYKEKHGLKTEPPPVTVCIVQKRHHVRFFPGMPGQNQDKSGNCEPGTIIDSCVTHPKNFDFYLQSHAGIQGTSRPTHYTVIHDENGYNSDAFQQLTYNLCHVYQRATRAVSVPCPVYYAHTAAFRSRSMASRHNIQTGSVRQGLQDPNSRAADRSVRAKSGDVDSDMPKDRKPDYSNSNLVAEYRDTFRPVHSNIKNSMYFA
jgi:eukaryotic translation initiation factor 2C